MKTDKYTISGDYYVERLGVFSDSMELAQLYHKAAEDAYHEGGDIDFLSEKTRDHILGLWLFAKECVDKIEDLERELVEEKIKNDKQQF